MKLTKLNDIFADGDVQKGSWELGRDGLVRYRRQGKSEEASIRARLVAIEPGKLVISATSRQEDQKTVTRLLSLTGEWWLDGKNELIFDVSRGKGRTDTLVFSGGLRVGSKNELVYSYTETLLSSRRRITREISLKGHWDIPDGKRLVYSLDGDDDAALHFRGAFQTQSILAKKGEIRYQLGVEMSRLVRARTITLFGKWLLSRDLSVAFEIETGRTRRTARFGGVYSFGSGRSLEVTLISRTGEAIGVEVVFTKELLKKDGGAFLRLLKTAEESRLEGGFKVRW